MSGQTSETSELVSEVSTHARHEHRDDQISLADEAALNWYFGQGLSIYDRSTFGAIIQKLANDSMGSGPCPKCAGEGILDQGGFRVEDKCRRCDGEGVEPGAGKACAQCRGTRKEARYDVQVPRGGWCSSCRGTGATGIDRRHQRPSKCRLCVGDRKSPETRACSNCLGTGNEQWSARPKTGGGSDCGVSADDAALTRFAVTSRRLERVRAKSPALFVVLHAYYGDLGARWGLTDRGRVFALYHLTQPGKKLARMSKSDVELTMQERIGVQASLDQQQPKRERTILLHAAGEQSVQLYGRASKAWIEGRDHANPKTATALVERAKKLGLVVLANHIALHASRPR